MKSFTAALTALAGTASAQNLFESLLYSADNFIHEVTDTVQPMTEEFYSGVKDQISAHTTKVSKNRFGALVEESIFPYPYVEKKIKAPLVPYHMDYV